MKKSSWYCFFAVVMICLSLSLSALAEKFTLAVATDLHVQEGSPNAGLANPLVPYNVPILEALLRQVGEQDVDALILLGDITNQGRHVQHDMLTERLHALAEKGKTILVLPGNHDIGEVSAADFPEVYAEFGYSTAHSRDESSLSYSALLDGGLLVLMLDTNGYEGDKHRAFLSEQTLEWMEAQLEEAALMGWQVVAAGHFPLLTEQTTPFTGKEEAIALFGRYGVQIYLCGHLHGRNVARQDGLTELVVDQAIAYPCCYAMLDMDGQEIRYLPEKIDVEAWAAEQAQPVPELLGFERFQRELTVQRSNDIVEKLIGEKKFTESEIRQADDFFFKLMDYGAQGMLNRYAGMMLAHPGYGVFLRMAEGTIYQRWTPSVLQNTTPYEAGFTLRGGEILTPEEDEK